MSSQPAPSAAASAAGKICFNSLCKGHKSEPTRKKGWRLRTGEYAELCDRCSCVYEQGTFCETFHADAGGWRNCESCGKRVHCGCVVSAPAFMLLDGGGIECVACARKGMSMAPKQMWSSSLLLPVSERPKEFPVRGRNQVSGQVPGQWRQAANLWNVASAQSELHQRLAYEFDRPSLSDKLLSSGRTLISAHEKKTEDPSERIASTSQNHVSRDRYANGTICLDSVSACNTYGGEEGKTNGSRDSVHHVVENDATFTRNGLEPCSTISGIKYEEHPNSCVNSLMSSGLKEDLTSPLLGLAAPFQPQNDPNDSVRAATIQPARQAAPPSVRQNCPNSQNSIDHSVELQAHMRNGRPRADARPRAQFLPRYWPRLTDQELQQISGDSNAQITPLFEKMLSASDAGRIGRLVLPKKCAEAYFPPISHAEGLPLKVQDATGKEWVFQFRFWPNNNSRMYVLEGVTPCIQSMQLQAGDTVTFSRMDPEGKLIMGYRKASIASPEQENSTLKAGNGSGAPPEANSKSIPSESVPTPPLRPLKGNSESRNPTITADQGPWSKLDKSDFIQKNGSAVKSSQAPSKRKGSALGTKSKRLRMDHEDSIQLKLTWDVAQDLLRPPPNRLPTVVIIEGHEFEEYEEAPVIGMPTFFATDQDGQKSQWAQCEDCSKWRKLPADAFLPSKWTCSDNLWDRKRSLCTASQELSMEQLAYFLPIKPGTSKRSMIKAENDVVEVSDGLDTLANLAILGEGEELPPSSQPTTKHPRHRPGCTCIVCIQPPSGKGPKHKQACTCNVCLTVKRRFRTLMLRREKRQSEKDAENTLKKQQLNQSNEMLPQIQSDTPPTALNISCSPQRTVVKNVGAADEESEQRRSLASPLKAQIDLNIQPEREEEPSPVSNAGSIVRVFSDATP